MNNEFCLNCASKNLGYEPITQVIFCEDCGFQFDEEDIQNHFENNPI